MERLIWHVANSGCWTWAEFGRTLAEAGGFDPNSIIAMNNDDDPISWPKDLTLATARGQMLSETRPAIDRYLADVRQVNVPKASMYQRICATLYSHPQAKCLPMLVSRDAFGVRISPAEYG